MNILIFDGDELSICIPYHSVAHFQVLADAVQIHFADGHELRCESTSFYVVNNSARRLIHAITTGADRVHLSKHEFLTVREFEQYQKARPVTLAGFLPDAVVPLVDV